ncbi:CTP synthase [Striga asiatica]|uniref:CTP synthase n=1 Tax=Striga asiatica TaxID=4170 RepID=A0A5A7P006_STRAF|nr:CTP synthase [Striga asiatica]
MESTDEEKALINGLRDLVTRGWKCDNGFRNGYTTILEQHMRQQFPGTTIKAEPHISSKITVWKKNYGIVSDMLGSTGFGWNETGKMVTVRDDTVWDSYIKAHPKAKSMRYKSWPLYADWVEIFGKDRATGEGAQGFTDAVNDVLHDTNVEEPSPIPTEDQFPEQCDYPQTNFDSFSAQAGESSASGKSKRDGKRKRNVEPEDKIIGFLSSVCQETNNRLSELSTRVGYQANAKHLDDDAKTSMETDLQVFFHSNGFKWYNHCLQVWNVRGAADVDLESNPGANNDYPICLDDTMSDVWSEDGMEDEVEVQQDVAGLIHENPLWVDPLNDVQADEDIMDHESDVDSCVDSV